jgi:hypothetical protein
MAEMVAKAESGPVAKAAEPWPQEKTYFSVDLETGAAKVR